MVAYKVISKDLARYPMWRTWLKNSLRLPFPQQPLMLWEGKTKKIHPEQHYLGDT